MKHLFTITLTVITMAAFATTTFAGDGCGGSSDKGDKAKEKTEEGTAS